MNTQLQPGVKSLPIPSIAITAAIGLFVAIPFFNSHAQPAASSHSRAAAEVTRAVPVLGGKLVFRDATAQSTEFIGYYHSIKLTPKQEAIKKAALEPMPAACCRNSTAYSCCCPCNLSKTIWGLSNLAIARYGADAGQVRHAVQSWLRYVNPTSGFSGDACYRGTCDTPAHRGGCAGMDESKLIVQQFLIPDEKSTLIR